MQAKLNLLSQLQMLWTFSCIFQVVIKCISWIFHKSYKLQNQAYFHEHLPCILHAKMSALCSGIHRLSIITNLNQLFQQSYSISGNFDVFISSAPKIQNSTIVVIPYQEIIMHFEYSTLFMKCLLAECHRVVHNLDKLKRYQKICIVRIPTK